ncbi:MAG: CPXCG motif-containing cysteine-rich protein [Pseudomonadota bacterium]
MLRTASVQCPYCWESIELVIDCSLRRQEYVEDCQVCCRPIVVRVVVKDGGIAELDVRTEDE